MPLSSKQMEYLALAWQCFESEPKIDYEKFKTVAGLASAHSARELMRVTKNKLRDEYGALSTGIKSSNAGAAANGTPKKNKTPTSARKRGTPGKKARGEYDEDEEGSPRKKVRREIDRTETGKKHQKENDGVVKKEAEDEEEDGVTVRGKVDQDPFGVDSPMEDDPFDVLASVHGTGF